MQRGKAKKRSRSDIEIELAERLEKLGLEMSLLKINYMFYLAKNEEGHYLCGIDQNNNPIFSENYDEALWSYNQDRLNGYINGNSISASSESGQGGNNPPQKPPF
jgi:hypothetical protein